MHEGSTEVYSDCPFDWKNTIFHEPLSLEPVGPSTRLTWWFPRIGGTPKSSILMGPAFSLIKQPFWIPPFMEIPRWDRSLPHSRKRRLSTVKSNVFHGQAPSGHIQNPWAMAAQKTDLARSFKCLHFSFNIFSARRNHATIINLKRSKLGEVGKQTFFLCYMWVCLKCR